MATTGKRRPFTIATPMRQAPTPAPIEPPPPPFPELWDGHQPQKIYFGFSTSQNYTTAYDQLGATPKTHMGVRRLYSKNSDVGDMDTAGHLVWLSGKPDDLGSSANPSDADFIIDGSQDVASGTLDASIRSYFTSLVARNVPTVWTYYHEPTGDGAASSSVTTAASAWCDAFRQIISVVDAQWPTHRIAFCPNIEEFRFRSPGTVDLSLWHPADLMASWDLWTFDLYQYGSGSYQSGGAATTTANSSKFSNRMARILNFFQTGAIPGGGTAGWMNYTIGHDLVFGIGEHAARPQHFVNYEATNLSNLPAGATNNNSKQYNSLTGAKWARDAEDYIFAHPEYFSVVSWFNSSTGVSEERIVPDTLGAGTNGPHASYVTQTGDTETTLQVVQEKLLSGLTCRLADL